MLNDERVWTALDDGNAYLVETYIGGKDPCVVMSVNTDAEVWLSPEETRELVRALRVACERAATAQTEGAA